MNYSTFHGANSVNTFNMLLDDYVADQLNEFDKEVVKIFTQKREIDESTITLTYPDEVFTNTISQGHKIAVMDIHSYNNLRDYYLRECINTPAFFQEMAYSLQETYIRLSSKNILTIETTMGDVLEQVFNILSIKTEGILFGIILNLNDKNYNLTHPSVLQLLLDEYDWLFKSYYKCTLYIYINEDEDDCRTLRELNEKTYSISLVEIIDKEEYKEILKKNILFSCALIKSKITKGQRVTIDSSSLVDYSAHDIYFTYANHGFSSSNRNILNLQVNAYLPQPLRFPDDENLIDIPYYIPVDILAKGVFVPYYGGVILRAKLNINTGICKTEYDAMHISPFKSPNIYPADREENTRPTDFTRVCTGKLNKYDLDTICSVNYANANSAYHHQTIATGFLEAIELNIEIAYSMLADYLRKDINESKNNNENNNESSSENSNESSSESTRAQEGSDTDLQSSSSGDSTMETEVAKSNNPFERDISYQQRISGSHVEPSVS